MKRGALVAALVLSACVHLVSNPEHHDEAVIGDASLGAYSVVELGCTGCHAIADPGFVPVASDLTSVGRKLTREWIYTRLVQPGRVEPATRESKHGWARPAALAEFSDDALAVAIATSLAPAHRASKAVSAGDAARGRGVYERNGCAACHGELSDAFVGEGSKVTADWLDKWLASPASLAPATTMPQVSLSANDRADLVKTLSGLHAPTIEATWPRPSRELSEQLAALVERLGTPLEHAGAEVVEAFGCGGCHAGVAPKAPTARPLPALATKEGILYTRGLWQAKADHPQFAGQQQALDDVAAWLSGPLNLPPADALVYRRLGCAACHGGDGPGPDLRDAVDKFRLEWLVDFIAEPSSIRPNGQRMPHYALQADEVRALVRYLLRDVDPYERLDIPLSASAAGAPTSRDCSNCHDKNAPSLSRVLMRLRPSYVLRYLHTHPTATDDAGALQRARALVKEK